MTEREKEHEEKAQLALNALRRAVEKAYADGTALDLRTAEAKTSSPERKAA